MRVGEENDTQKATVTLGDLTVTYQSIEGGA